MARRTHTYAIRLAVEGGGQVKAELVTVGQSGEQSLKRIETAGDKASGGLKGLGRQAELLRTGIRTLGDALIGAATVGGLGALIDRSISAADAIGKTADKIGVGVEALQELRFAAKASGVEQQTLDMALQRFTRRAAEAAQGTGEAKDALAQMGIALRDQDGHLRRSEDLLADVADAFASIQDPAERVRLAFKLFDSEGVALVNLLRGGSGALEEMRERARDLGIVLDEHLVRDAERARTEVDTLAQVISANLTRAALEAAPVIADLSSWLADVAGKAGIAWERLFDAPEEKSLRTLRYELDLASSTIEKLEGRIRELRESPTLGFTTFLDTAQISALERKLDELQPPAWSLPNAKWRGAVIYRSGDGISFTDYSAVTTSALWAKAKTVLPAHERWGIWDEDNALDLLVQSPGLEFESKTELEVLDGANLLLVGQEIIQFADAEQLGASEWRVSKLLRGRRGTEWAMSTHQVGEIVLALDPATLIRVSSLDEVGLSRLYRAVSIGSDPSLPEAVSFTNEAAPAPVMKTRSMGMSFLH